MDSARKNKVLDGAEKYLLTCVSATCNFCPMLTRNQKYTTDFPRRNLPLRVGISRRGNFPPKIKMKVFHDMDSNRYRQNGGGPVHEAKMSAVSVQNDVPAVISRRARVPELWTYVGAHDNHKHGGANVGIVSNESPQTPQGANWGDFERFRTLFPSPVTSLSLTKQRHICYRPLDSSEICFKFDCSRLILACHTLTLRAPSGSKIHKSSGFRSSLFLLGSVIDVTERQNCHEIQAEYEVMEGSKRTSLASGGSFRGHKSGHSLRPEALRPCFPLYEADRVGQSSQENAVGMGRGEDRTGQKRSGAMAPCLKGRAA